MPLIGLFAVLCIVPLVLLTYTTINLADQAVVREVNARVRTTSAVTAVLVRNDMQSLAELTRSYANRPLLITALADGRPEHFNGDVINVQLTQLLTARPGIGGVFLTDTSCRLTHTVPATPTIIGKDFSFRDWCRGVKATGRPYVSDAYRTAIQGTPLVVAAAAYVQSGNGAGEPLGILSVVYRLDAIKGFADQMAKVQGVGLTIADKRGTVLVGRPRKQDKDGLGSAAGEPLVREALAGRSGVLRSTTAQGDTLSGFAPVDAFGWAVTAEVPVRSALAGVRELRSTVLTVAGLVGLVMMAGLVIFAQTLRRRRDADQALVERDAHTRAILEAATDAFVSMDFEGRITGWNAQAIETFGWTEAEALGRRLSDTIIPTGQRQLHEAGLARFKATGDAPILNQRIGVTALHRDGHEFPAELAIWPVQSGETCSFNAFVQDITERKQAEVELATARDQALEASRLKSEFLANMSHEIRTPMNGVLGMTSLLLNTDLRVDQRDFAETVRSSGEALLSILNDILDFSKIEAGRLDLEEIDFDLRTLVEDVASLLSLAAHDKGLELVCSLPVDMPATVRGDPSRLRQILTNLVGNAVKFTAAGEVLVDVTVADRHDASPSIRFEVVDTGIGIARDAQTAIFESFTQADAGTTRRYGGTGLGLSISRQLVELMGGRMGLESEPGEGCTFWFTVPLHQVTQPVTSATPLAGLHVLGVDDNATNRTILSRFLHVWGARSEDVDGATAALAAATAAAARSEPFDVALLDLNMPDMDGIELARAIGADADLRSMRLVLLTSSGQHGEAVRAHDAGIVGFLPKPVRQSLLFDCLRTLVTPKEGTTPDDIAAAAVIAEAPPQADGQRLARRILLAEDNTVNQRVATLMLAKLGCQTDVVGNGAEAVEASKLTPYDAILMDCHMPVLDGYEATAEIRRLEDSRHRTPIIAVTASAMKADQDRCQAAGMDDYLAKPFTLEALTDVLARNLPYPANPATDGAPTVPSPLQVVTPTSA